jgi:hypothetical protein
MKSYPDYLLPKPHFKVIQNIELLKKGVLIHYTDSKDNRDLEGFLREDSVVRHRNHIRDYSNNLLGIFEIEDIFIDITVSERKDYFISPWDLQEVVEAPIYDEDFIINNDRGYFFLNIKEIHNKEIHYEDNDPKLSLTAICKVLHTPTKSNFWHFSLRWYTDQGLDINDLEQKQKKGLQRRILTAAKSLIILKAFFEEPSYSEPYNDIYT